MPPIAATVPTSRATLNTRLPGMAATDSFWSWTTVVAIDKLRSMRAIQWRLIAAGTIGCLAGALSYWTRTRVTGFSDFDGMWVAGRSLAARTDPFVAVHAVLLGPLLYPMPAILVTWPFAVFSISIAAAVWTGVSFAFLAFGLSRHAWWPLIAMASLPAVESAQLAQWSPILTCMALFPGVAILALAKPTTGGMIALAYLPNTARRSVIIGGAVLVLVSLAIVPTWIGSWTSGVLTATYFRPMILRPFGWVLLFALLKWRRPEARLIAFLAIVPQAGMAYEALPLALVPSSRREAMVSAFASFTILPWRMVAQDHGATFTSATAHNAPLFLVALYLPALLMVLRRPNHST